MRKSTPLYILFYIGFVSCLSAGNVSSSADFSNISQLDEVFAKLLKLEKEKTGKVNIVHIGDSHIQADMLTNSIRQPLQKQFGNGGYGVTFPYTLAKTNGSRFVKYESQSSWHNLKNIYPLSDIPVGLSGIALYINSNSFKIELNVDKQYAFNTIKLLYPTVHPSFSLVNSGQQTSYGINLPEPVRHRSIPNQGRTVNTTMIPHRVAAGETLYRISMNYKVDIQVLKRVNNLRSSSIQTGKILNIPQDTVVIRQEIYSAPEAVSEVVEPIELKTQAPIFYPYVSTYTYAEPQTTATILPNKKQMTYNLSGIVLENNKPGLIYHTIGINGSRSTDFSKYPLFFDQLTTLTPDLVVISFGTNESFGKISPTRYVAQITNLINNIRKRNKGVAIIVCTPPPSFFKRKEPNMLVADYAKELLKLDNCVVWDLYSKMKNTMGVSLNSSVVEILARDKIHYTKDGYEQQGFMFSSDFLKAYNLYKKNNR